MNGVQTRAVTEMKARYGVARQASRPFFSKIFGAERQDGLPARIRRVGAMHFRQRPQFMNIKICDLGLCGEPLTKPRHW